MYCQKLFIRCLLCVVAFILITLSILLAAYSRDTNLTYPRNEVSQLINLQEFAFFPIQCNVIFDVYKYGFCIDVPSYYYHQYPNVYDKQIYYFNILPHINYSKMQKCQIDDMILYINKLDVQYMDMFWIIS